jgi:NADPH-dependent ferric siderophore reductase
MTTARATGTNRLFAVRVSAVTRLSPSFVRLTFAGVSLAGFHDGGRLGTRAVRIELLIPPPSRPSSIVLPDARDPLIDCQSAVDVDVSRVVRGSAPHGARLTAAVQGLLTDEPPRCGRSARPAADVDVAQSLLWDVPGSRQTARFYAWVAGEAATVRELRRHLVGDLGVDREQVAFMGYWRRGRIEASQPEAGIAPDDVIFRRPARAGPSSSTSVP